MSEQDLKNQKKISQLSRLIRVSIYILAAIILLTSSILGFVIVNKESRFSQWVVDSSFLGSFIKLNNSKLKEQENQRKSNQIANSILGLNPENNAVFKFSPGEESFSTIEVVDKVIPAVLSITVEQAQTNQLFDEKAAGTGYIVNSSGLVVSNKHVISSACSNENVSISGINSQNNSYKLELISVDPVEDIAILKIVDTDQKEFPFVKFADSNAVKLGTEVLAIGNALGELQNTVTKGIISGLNRSINSTFEDNCTGTKYFPDNLIQTDAAINQGNSGGPLFNSSGLILGMNTYGTGGENIGLAIPSARIVSALNSFEKNGKIIRPRLGVTTRTITDSLQKRNPWIPKNYGEIVYNKGENPILPDSAAAKSNLKEGDIILEVNGVKLEQTENSTPPLKRLLLNYDANSEIELTILRSTGKNQNSFQYQQTEEKIKLILGGQSANILDKTLQ
jgi:serine protease Do